MKKAIAITLALILSLSFTFSSAVAVNNGNNGRGSENSSNADKENKGKKSDEQKAFLRELNDQKKDLQQQKSALMQEIEKLQEEYDALIEAGDTVSAEALLESIAALQEECDAIKDQIKQTINERFMIVKTLYTDEELAQYDSAADVIAQMYADAFMLQAGSVTVNNNLIKFDAPPYIKGGVTMVPLRAVSEILGAEVSWDAETQTVSIVKDDITVEFTAGGTTVYVNGEPVEITLPAEITNGRTYLPLRFMAETLEFIVNWDGENQLIDIDDPDAEDPAAEDPAAEDPAAEDSAAEEPAAEEPPAEDPPAEDPPAETPPAETPPAE